MSFLTSFVNSLPGSVCQGLIWGIMAIGVYITFRILDFADLTVDGSLALGGAVSVMLLKAGYSPIFSMLVATLSGLVAGFITGFLHTKCKIPAILAGILTQLALYSINLRVLLGHANQAVSAGMTKVFVSQRFVREASITNPNFKTIGLLAIIIALLYTFFGTEMGCAVRAVGCNAKMARAQGINTDSYTILALMLSNGLVALSGAAIAQFQGSADVNMGRGAIVIGLAAVIIGEVLFSRIFKNFALRLAGVVLGAVIYYLVISAVLQLGLNTNDLKLLSAAVVAVFLTAPNIKNFKFLKGGRRNA